MKKSILFIALFMAAYIVTAQNSEDYIELAREILKTEKKSAIAGEMNLTDAELVPFWDLYNEYNNRLKRYYVQTHKRSAQYRY